MDSNHFSNGIEFSLPTLALEEFGHLRLTDEIAQEFFSSIINVFSRTIKNIMLSLTAENKNFKRGELLELLDAEKEKINNLFKKEIADLSLYKACIPGGFTGNYLDACGEILFLLDEMKYGETLNLLLDFFNKISNMIKQKMTSDRQYLEEIKKIFSSRPSVKNITSIYKKYFTDRHDIFLEVPATSIYGSFEEVKNTKDVILDYEKYFKDSVSISTKEKIKSISTTVDDITVHLDGLSPDINKKYVKDFYEIIYTFAMYLDSYGSILMQAQLLEHNYVLTLRKMMVLKV